MDVGTGNRSQAVLLRLVLLAAGSAVPLAAASGEGPAMTGDAIRSAIVGATVSIHGPMGSVIPVEVAPEGTLTGTAGGLRFFLGAAADKGRWWIDGHRLCMKWQVWFDAEKSCMEIRRQGNGYAWRRDDGKTGTATIVARAGHDPATIKAAATAPLPAALGAGPPKVEPPEHAVSQTVRIDGAPATPIRRQPTAQPVLPPAAKQLATGQPSAVPPAPSLPAKRLPAAPAAPAVAQPGASIPAFSTTIVPVPPRYRVVGVRPDDMLNMRSAPTTKADVVGQIPPDAAGVRRSDICIGEWCQVTYAGKTGWVNRYFLTVVSAVSIPRS